MSSLQRYSQVPSLRKEIRLIKSSNQKSRECLQQASSSIILTGNTYNESKRTIDSTKFISRKEQSYFGNTQQNNKSINMATAATVLWTSPQILNSDSNYFSDNSPRYDETCRKSFVVENQNMKSQQNSRQDSSNISKASHLNLSKYIQDSQVSFDNDYIQEHTPTPHRPEASNGTLHMQTIQDEEVEKEKKPNKAQVFNSCIKEINKKGRDIQNKQQSFSIEDYSSQVQFHNKSFNRVQKQIRQEEDLDNQNNNHKVGLKSPLSYQNLIKSLAKYTKMEKDLLEETIFLEKQIQDSQDKINQLLSTSDRELSLEQYAISPKNSKYLGKTQSQISNKGSQSMVTIDTKDNKDFSYITPKLRDGKEKLQSSQKQQNNTNNIQDNKRQDKQNAHYQYLLKGNISQRSKKNRFHENITKLRQFQKELQRGEGNQDSNKQISQDLSQLHLSLSNINYVEDSQLLSSKRLFQFSQSPFIKDKKIRGIQKNRLEKDSSQNLQHSSNCCFNVNCIQGGSQSSSYFQNVEKTPTTITCKQDTNRTSSFIQKCSAEQFPFHIFSTDRLQKQSSIKSIQKERFQNYFMSSCNSQMNNSNQNSLNGDNSSMNPSLKGISNQNKQPLTQLQSEKKLTQQQIQQQQDAKSNKKLEILNLLSKINNKGITTPSSKQNKSYTTFEKVNCSTPTSEAQINLSQTSLKKHKQLLFESEQQFRKSSRSNSKRLEDISIDSSSNNNYVLNQQKEGQVKGIPQVINGISQSAKAKLKNTLTENLRHLLSNTSNRNVINKQNIQLTHTCRVGSNNNQNISMKSLLQHIFNKSSQNENNKK